MINSAARYISTRGGMAPARFRDVLLGGLAPDGGLTLPKEYPRVTQSELCRWLGYSYQELAFEIMSKFIDDISTNMLWSIINDTYKPEVFCHARDPATAREITPVRSLGSDLYLLELSNGPSLAFKDVALQLLGNLFEYVLRGTGTVLNVLGATSGDTGPSAEYALEGKSRVRVFMLSPLGGMSEFQTAQMYSIQENNIFNLVVRGAFDTCQDIAKRVSEDADFKLQYSIGAVNSFNWARVLAQIVYYFKAYFAVTRHDYKQVDFVVPSGNFGNICAGHIARMMGLPIRRLILATNENTVLDEFFKMGIYHPRPDAQVHHTTSPSMDISKASNFERFIFSLMGRDSSRIRELWREIAATGQFNLSKTTEFATIDQFGFVSGASTHANRIEMIQAMYAEYGLVVDPHTADGLTVGLQYQEAGVPLICLETALPAKFDNIIQEALCIEAPRPMAFEGIEKLPQRFEILDPDVNAVKAYIASHQ